MEYPIDNVYDSRSELYSFDTFEDINSIPIPKGKFAYQSDFTESVEYILQRKATEFKRKGNIKLAIACLKKAVEIMPYAPISYTIEDYKKLVKYLEFDGEFDMARMYKQKIDDLFYQIHKDRITNILNSAKEFETDLLEASYHTPASELESKYRGRIYSISGNDTRFPKLPMDIFDTRLNLSAFIYGISSPVYCNQGQEIIYSNRPFIDDRSNSEKEEYEKYIKKIQDKAKTEREYSWILENLKNIAPKSLNGYSKMKKSKSKKFEILVQKAHEKGFEIN